MTSVCFYFQVHQPCRLGRYTVFDIGKNHNYFFDEKNKAVMEKIANKCYLPMNNLLLDSINATRGKFRVAFSISGTAIEQFERYAPRVLDSFKALADTGYVEFLSETNYHTLSWLYSKKEFKDQIALHRKKIRSLFGYNPQVFRNTELIYNNELGLFIEELGYRGILAEGWDKILEWRSPNFVYKPAGAKRIRLLLKNYKLSDDIAFRFSNRSWTEWPLTADKYAAWIAAVQGQSVNLFMDYETFGEHQWEDTGIFNFMRHLPQELLKYNHIDFKTPTELTELDPVAELNVPYVVSWADMERDLSAWVGNKMQQSALYEVYKLEKAVKESGDEKLLEDWRKLQTSDHFYYMCIKYFSDGDVHKYFNPYDTPYDSYLIFMNVLNDIKHRLKHANKQTVLSRIKNIKNIFTR